MEIWKPIKGYNERYSISSLGRVQSHKTGLILKPSVNHKGYFIIQLSIFGKKKNHRVHRLVAQAFIPNPDHLPEVDHINGNRQENTIDNLRWASPSSNTRNREVCRKASSKHNGVYRQDNKWVAIIRVKRKNIYLGSFVHEIEAAFAFNDFVVNNNLQRELNIMEV